MSIHRGKRIHLELRKDTFVLYTDMGKEQVELPYGDADEVIEQLTRVVASDQYALAPLPKAQPQASGHILPDSPKPLRKSTGNRRKMVPICEKCNKKASDKSITDLSQREFNAFLCRECYTQVHEFLYPRR